MNPKEFYSPLLPKLEGLVSLPFLMIDRVIELVPNEKLVAIKNVSVNEAQFQGHFPDEKVMPGVLMIEAMRQASSHLLALSADLAEPAYRLLRAESVRFGQFVQPGSLLRITARLAAEKVTDGAQVDGRIELVSRQGVQPGARAISARLTLVPVSAQQQEKEQIRQRVRVLLESIRQERQSLI